MAGMLVWFIKVPLVVKNKSHWIQFQMKPFFLLFKYQCINDGISDRYRMMIPLGKYQIVQSDGNKNKMKHPRFSVQRKEESEKDQSIKIQPLILYHL